jgi:hypothetical protein
VKFMARLIWPLRLRPNAATLVPVVIAAMTAMIVATIAVVIVVTIVATLKEYNHA